jgi:hypothetical protein
MQIDFFVEEPSAEAALGNLLPRILPEEVIFEIRNFQSKDTLLKELPKRLRGYKSWFPSDLRIVVLIDEDREDCKQLKARLEKAAQHAGLKTKSQSHNFQILNRIVVEELEAWFFGDVEALVTAYPKVPSNLANKEKFRDPDAITGGTWEALERLLQKAGYYSGGLPKIEVARKVSEFMEPSRNRSKSFQVFKEGLEAVLNSFE